MSGRVFIVSGPSGVGKGTVIRGLLAKDNQLVLAVSATTRPPRDGDKEGETYYFLSDQQFDEYVDDDAFLEWCLVHGNRYGTLKKEIHSIVESGRDVLLEIDTQGARKIKKVMPEVIQLFLAPPSLEELESRLRGRQTESDEVISRRLERARQELDDVIHYDYVVLNTTVDDCLQDVVGIISKERHYI